MNTTTISVIANGEAFELESDYPLHKFLADRKLNPLHIVVEHNGKALTKAETQKLLLQNSDKLEIVQIVAGG